MKKLDYIDALRGLAILAVIMVHTGQYGSHNMPGSIGNVITKGSMGVQLFYIASAFTLFLSFKTRVNRECSPIRNFFLRRFFRIAPMYYLGICYYLFQDGFGPRYWLGDETHITTLNIVSNFTFLHGFNPYWITSVVPGGWSIGVEMTFYVILPLLFSKIKNLNQAFYFFVVSLLLRLGLKLVFMKFHLITSDDLWNQYLFMYFPNQLPVFCLGIILYFIIIEDESMKNISGKLVLIFTGLLIAQLGIDVKFVFPDHILFGIAFVLLGYALSKYRFLFIVNPIVIWIGKISFSMYLVHFAILHWITYFHFVDYFENWILNYFTRFFVVSILSMVVSTILYKIIEVPFQDFGKKLIDKLEKVKPQTAV